MGNLINKEGGDLKLAYETEKIDGRDLEGYFAIDVKSRREQWRIILESLDENISPYNPCKIDEIAEQVKIIGVMEVSRHYE